MGKLYNLCSDLCDISGAICWPNYQQICHEMVIAPEVLGTNVIVEMARSTQFDEPWWWHNK